MAWRDGRYQMTPATAAWAAQNIDPECPLQELSPGYARGMRVSLRRLRARGDQIPDRRCGCEGSEVSPAVIAGMGDESDEALEE